MPVNSPSNLAFGFRIEGIGEERVDEELDQKQLLFATSAARGHELLFRRRLSLHVRPVLDESQLGSTEKWTELFKKGMRWGSLEFSLRGEDQVAERFFSKPKKADFVTTSDLSQGASTVETDADSGELESRSVYLREETLLLGEHDPNNNNPGEYEIQIKGAFGSSDLEHPSGTSIFEEPPFWTNREVKFSCFHIGGGPDFTDGASPAASLEETIRYQGRLADDIRQEKGQVIVPTSELHGPYSDVISGFEERKLEAPVTLEKQKIQGSKMQVARISAGANDYEPKILKSSLPHPVSGELGFQIKNQVTFGRAFKDASGDYRGVDIPFSHALWGGEWSDDLFDRKNGKKGTVSDDVYEVMLFDRLDQLGVKASPLVSIGNSKGDSVFNFHILSLYAAVHLSTNQEASDPDEYDIFQPDWSLNMKNLFVNSITSDIDELIKATPWARIDQLVIGEGGEGVKLREEMLSLLHAFGFTEGVTSDGKLFIERLKPLDIEQHNTALDNQVEIQPNDEVWTETTGRKNATSAVSVTYGDVPVDSGDPSSIKYEVDNPTLNPSRASKVKQGDFKINLPVSTVNESNFRSRIISRISAQNFEIPRVTIRTKDIERISGVNFGLLRPVNIKDPPIEPEWILDRAGVRTSSTGGDKTFSGIVTKVRFIPTGSNKTLSYELTIALTSAYGRWRSPSGIVREVTNSGQTFRLEGESGDSSFGDTKSDAERFTVGDEVTVFGQDGTSVSSGERTVTSIDSSNNTITVDSDFNSNPSVGDVIELSHIDTDGSGGGYENTSVLNNIDRAYVFLADSNDTIGDDEVEADLYGG